MRVVFLDFDGVLNSAKYRSTVKDCHRDFIDERKLEQLGEFVREVGAEIVLSTSWRRFWSEGEKQEHPEGEIINLLFAKYGMKIYSKTESDVRRALSKEHCTIDDFMALISPAAIPYLEEMAVLRFLLANPSVLLKDLLHH